MFSPGPASAPDTAARQPAAWQAASSHFDWKLQYEEDMADTRMGLISSSLRQCLPVSTIHRCPEQEKTEKSLSVAASGQLWCVGIAALAAVCRLQEPGQRDQGSRADRAAPPPHRTQGARHTRHTGHVTPPRLTKPRVSSPRVAAACSQPGPWSV